MQTTRALMLLLVTLCSLTANAQLTPGSTWRWAVASGGGQAERLFFVFEGNAPPPRRITERWTLEVGKRGDDGRTPATLKIRAKDGNSDFHFVTWLEGDELVFRDADRPADAAKPVVQRQAPPRVLSTERVPCTSALLGAGDGLCAGRAGGPLNAPPVPFSLVLSEDEHAASDGLMSLAIGVMTGGFIIPGHEDTSVIATLEAPPRSPLAPHLERWRKGPRTVAALEKLGLPAPLDVETAGALVVLGGPPTLPVLEALSRALPEEERWVLLRLARQQRLAAAGVVSLVARLSADGALHATEPALQTSALLGLDDALRVGIDGLLAGGLPELRAIAPRVGTPGFEAAVLEKLEKATLAPGEGAALATLLPEAARARAAPRFLERLPDAEGLAVAHALLEPMSPGGRVQFLQRAPRWVDRQLAAGHGAELFSALSFDDERAKVLDGSLGRAAEGERPALLVVGVKLLTFDDGRLATLRKWKATVAQLTLEQRLLVLDSFFQGDTLDAGAELLSTGLEGAARSKLTLAWLLKTYPPDHRVELLAARNIALDGAQARTFFASLSFDSERLKAAPTLLRLLPAGERGALLVELLAGMSFESGRLELLTTQAAVARGLSPAQRAKVLAGFPFEAKAAAAVLDGSPPP